MFVIKVVGEIMSELEINLENLRNKLISLILVKELTDDEVVSCSHELDKLIVEYQQKIYFEQ